jgi:hypothetical protein
MNSTRLQVERMTRFADAGLVSEGADGVGQAGGGMARRSRTSSGAVV